MKRYELNIVIWLMVCVLFFISACSPRKSAPPPENNMPEQQITPMSEPTPTPTPTPTPSPAKNEGTVDSNIIGTFQTVLINKDSDRIKNIELAAQKINGYVVEPGGIFSFNGVVGERSIAKGYKKAKIIVDEEYEEGIGGGVCQLSSTIYNAAQKAGMVIVERHSHSKDVHYVSKGKDAAVNYGTMDFKFKNNKDYPVQVKAGLKSNKVYVSIQKRQ